MQLPELQPSAVLRFPAARADLSGIIATGSGRLARGRNQQQ